MKPNRSAQVAQANMTKILLVLFTLAGADWASLGPDVYSCAMQGPPRSQIAVQVSCWQASWSAASHVEGMMG